MIKVIGNNKLKPLIEILVTDMPIYITYNPSELDIHINLSNQISHKKFLNNAQFIIIHFDSNKVYNLEEILNFDDLMRLVINEIINNLYENTLIYNIKFSKIKFEQHLIDTYIKNEENLKKLNCYWLSENTSYLETLNTNDIQPLELFNHFNAEILPKVLHILDINHSDPTFTKWRTNHLPPSFSIGVASMNSKALFLMHGISIVNGIIDLFKKKDKNEELTTLEDITDEELNFIKEKYEKLSKNKLTQTEVITDLKNKIDKYNIPLTLELEHHYLKLDDAYQKHVKGDYSHNIELPQIKQNFRNNKKRYLDLSHYNSKNEFNKSLKSKSITFSNGILLLCYWRLYYYHNDLYRDLNNIKGNISTTELTNILVNYYEFINLDLGAAVEDYLFKIEDLILKRKDKNIEDISNKAYIVRKEKQEEYQKIENNLLSDCIDLVYQHFNLDIVKFIAKEYTLAFYKHELVINSLEYKDIDLSLYL
ncbi:hypothetical protein [Staphylococcus hominis]|mgnify:CR=1 FL=1|uniref:hypothetical protein n=1 Tax=Staphylococcus hominis TaxID=1290 RepID=UPI003DA0B3DE